MNRYQRIQSTRQQRIRLSSMYGVTERSVFNALGRDVDTERSRRIRYSALKMGCVDMIYAPAGDVWIQESGYLVQESEEGDVRRISLDAVKIEEIPAEQELKIEEAEIIKDEQ